jgi:hypothetical protein
LNPRSLRANESRFASFAEGFCSWRLDTLVPIAYIRVFLTR